MPNFGQLPQQSTLIATTTYTQSTTSSPLTLPSASSYRLIFQVNTVSGTSPTLQAIVCTSFDNGTTYNEILSTTQMTTSGQGRQLAIRPYLGIGDAATEAPTSLLGTADLVSGVVVNNGPINPAFIKIRFVAAGTTPSFAVTTQYAAIPQDLSD